MTAFAALVRHAEVCQLLLKDALCFVVDAAVVHIPPAVEHSEVVALVLSRPRAGVLKVQGKTRAAEHHVEEAY